MESKLSVELEAKIDKQKASFVEAKKNVSDYVRYTDAELLKSAQNQYAGGQKIVQINEKKAESFAAALKAQRLAAQESATASTVEVNSIEKTGSALTKAFSGLRTLAYILPGIGIAGIFNLAFEAIAPVIAQLDLFNSALDKSAEKYKLLNEAIQTGNKQAGEEVTRLKILYEAAINVANSTELRNKAARDLQKSFPETFKNASLEAIKAGELSDAYRQLTKDIIANARAKAIADKLGEIASKQLDGDIQKQKILNAQKNELSRVKGPIRTASLGGAGQQDALGSTVSVSAKAQRDDINFRAKTALDAVRINEKVLQDQADFLSKFTTQGELVDAVAKPDGKTGAKIKTISDVFKELNTQLLIVNETVTGTFDDQKKETIKAYQKAFEDLLKMGVNPVSIEIGNLQGKILQLSQTLQTSPLQTKITEGTTGGFNDLPTIDYSKLYTGQDEFLKRNTAFYKAMQNNLKAFNSAAKDIVNNNLTDTFSNIGTVIGDALSGGNHLIQALGATLLDGFADVLGQLGKLAISTGVALLAIKLGLKTLNPALLIGAGIGLVAASKFIHNGAAKISDSIGGSVDNSSSGSNSPNTNAASYTSSGNPGGGSLQTLEVLLKARGSDLVAVLNITGYNLSRFQQRGA